MPWGRTDKPLEATSDDKLKIGPYAKGLANFIETTTTPMTIGLQGEWGSGKTSLMQLVKKDVAPHSDGPKQHDGPVRAVWFDAWQYGALGNADMLGLLMLRDLSSLLLRDIRDDDSVGHRFMRRLGVAFKSAAPAVAGTLTNAVTGGVGGDVATNAMQGMLSDSGGESDLRKAFAALVAESLNKTNQKRMVIFIDDLDRIQPDRAVRLLEVLKNFMDVDKCVFVVACDYQVVREGVRKLMNITEKEDEKVDAFFHKIFQVPFHMPSSSYSIESMLIGYLHDRLIKAEQHKGHSKTFLDNGKKPESGAWLSKLVNVVRLGIGTNPRAFKRYMNLLDLMSCVDDAFEKETLSRWNTARAHQDETIKWIISLLPIIALQQRWQRSSPFILRKAGDIDKRLARKHPELKEITLFERRIRTLTQDWSGVGDENHPDRDNHESSVYPDGRLAGHLRALYGVGEESVHETDGRELMALRDFMTAWRDLLNRGQNRKLLTRDELAKIIQWSERMMAMGTTDAEVSKLELFEDACVESCELSGDDISAIPERILSVTKVSRAFPKAYPTPETFPLKLNFNNIATTLLNISSKSLKLTLHVGQSKQDYLGLPTLHSLGITFVEEIEALGISCKWTGQSSAERREKRNSVIIELKGIKDANGLFSQEKLNEMLHALFKFLRGLQEDVRIFEQRLENGESLDSLISHITPASEMSGNVLTQGDNAPEVLEEPVPA
ncbi:MAG: KAP family P-loop NTPase fold protein [Myxococcota bacterium]